MTVIVEIEVPDGCSKCPFFYSGTVFDWCKFPSPGDMDAYGQLKMENYDKRPKWCPLNKCKNLDSKGE